jgi:hypothetical protein
MGAAALGMALGNCSNFSGLTSAGPVFKTFQTLEGWRQQIRFLKLRI